MMTLYDLSSGRYRYLDSRSYVKIPHAKRAAVKRAFRDAAAKSSIVYSDYDAVDLAADTGNYFWSGLENKQIEGVLRFVRLLLTGRYPSRFRRPALRQIL